MKYNNFFKRMQAMGTNTGDVMLNTTIHFVNEEFDKSPSYKVMQADNTNVDVRLITDSNDSLKAQVYFRPGQGKEIGTYLVDGNIYWLIIDFIDHKIKPKANVLKCNEVLKWKDEIGTVYSYPCHIASSVYNAEFDREMYFADGKVVVYVQKNPDTSKIKVSDRFLFGQQPYEVVGVDDVFRDGLIRFHMKLDMSSPKDDDVADNPDQGGGGWW